MDEEQSLFDMDFEQVEASKDFSPIKPSVQVIKVVDVEGDFSSQKGTPCLKLSYELVEKDKLIAVLPGCKASERVNDRMFLSPKSLGFLRTMVEALGGDWTGFSQSLKVALGSLKAGDKEGFKQQVKDVVASSLIGLQGSAEISLETSETSGKKFNGVARYLRTATV